MGRKKDLPEEIVALLRASGKEWLVRQGGKHRKLIVEGRMIMVIPNGGWEGKFRTMRNAELAVRRALSA